MYKLLPLLFLLVFVSCGERRADIPADSSTINDPLLEAKDFYFTGEYVYYGGTARLRDCVTGAEYPIARQGDYLNAERSYTALAGSRMLPCYVTLKGHMQTDRQGAPKLVITDFGAFDTTRYDRTARPLTGTYRLVPREKDTESLELILKDDYTYTIVAKDMQGGGERTNSGRWGRLSEAVMVFMMSDRDDRLATINWQGPQVIFSGNTVFDRVGSSRNYN